MNSTIEQLRGENKVLGNKNTELEIKVVKMQKELS